MSAPVSKPVAEIPSPSDVTPAPTAAAAEGWGWTRPQRIGLGMLLTVLLAFLVVGYLRRPARLDDLAQLADSQPFLPQQLDPNAASAQELARVPHLGDTLAARIVAYREARRGTAAGGIVFRTAGDLDGVPGIGAKLADEFAPYFKFPEEVPASEP